MDVTNPSAHPSKQSEQWTEDLVLQALKGMEAAQAHCTCDDYYHHTWGMLRALGHKTGVKREEQILHELLTDLIANGTRVLIAGAADTATFCLCGRAARGRKIDITVLDRCAAPLTLVAGFAAERGLPYRTLHTDFAALEERDAFDIVLVHHALRFISPEQRRDCVNRLARALKPGGTLICSLKERTGAVPPDLDGLAAQWLKDTGALRKSADIPAPPGPRELEALLTAAGLGIICEINADGARASSTILVTTRDA